VDLLVDLLTFLREQDWWKVVTNVWVLAGAGVTALVGKYLADRLTDRRRQREAKSQDQRRAAKVREAMPDLLREMKQDLDSDPLVRQFVVLPTTHSHFWSEQRRFTYYEEAHDNLMGKLAMLANLGYIHDLRIRQDQPIFSMTEDFVDLLRQG
jgi:hypothetical protein